MDIEEVLRAVAKEQKGPDFIYPRKYRFRSFSSLDDVISGNSFTKQNRC